MTSHLSSVRRLGTPLTLSLSLVLPVAAGVQARQAPATPPAAEARPGGRREAPKNVNTLADVLTQVDWDPEERGPLLIVAPDKTPRYRPKPRFVDGVILRDPPVELRAPGARGYNLRNIDEVFDRKVSSAGRVTVLAPRTMTIFDLKFPPPDPYAGMSSSEKMAQFQGSLSPEQWGRMASEAGLGWGDLDEEQRGLLRSALPDPFVITKTVRTNDPERPFQGQPERITLTPAQLQGLRLSVRRKLSLGMSQEGERWSYRNLDPATAGPTFSIQSTENYYIEGKAELFGFSLKNEVPNQPKRGDLNFDAPVLSRSVALTGAGTIRDLVKRAAEATGVELYADPRYGALNVHVRGGQVRAGDVLKALALCVTGTWRRVEDGTGAKAWVLTDDLEGLGVRHAQIRRWGRANAALQAQRQKKVFDAVRDAKPESMLQYRPDDPFAPDENLGKAIAAQQELMNRPPDPKAMVSMEDGLQVPLAQMPEAVKQAAQRAVQEHKRYQQSKPLDASRVRVDMTSSLEWEVPGLGRVPASGIGIPGRYSLMRDEASFWPKYQAAMVSDLPKPPIALGAGATAGERVLLAAPRTPEESAALARSAAGRGFDRFWIDVPAEMSPESFGALVGAARQAAPGTQVFAVVRLLRAVPSTSAAPAEAAETDEPAPAVSPGRVDVNIVGDPLTAAVRRKKKEAPIIEPNSPFGDFYSGQLLRRQERSAALGDYLRPDLPENRVAIKARVRALARTPGLAGLVARDVLPPGYERAAGTNLNWFGDQASNEDDFGYTPEMRLAFLRRYGADPIDLVAAGESSLWSFQRYGGGGGNLDLRLPFFRDSGQAPPWEPTAAPTPGQPLPPLAAWNGFRREVAEAALDEVFQAVRAEPGGDALLLLRDRAGLWGGDQNTGYEEWERGAGVRLATAPPSATPPQEGPQPALSAKALRVLAATDSFLPAPGTEEVTPLERFGLSLAAMMRYAPPGGRGLVLDMSELPAQEAGLLLTAIRPSAAPTTRPARSTAAAAAAGRP